MTRNAKIAVLSVAVVALVATAAYAATLLVDNFVYPDGNLTDNPAWSAHSGAGTNPVQVNSEQVVIVHAGSAEDVNTNFGARGAQATTYACFDFIVPTPILGGPGALQYFAHFKDSGFGFRSRVYLSGPTGAGDFTLNIAVDNEADSPAVPWPSDLSFDTRYRVVHNYDAAAGTATLWLDPVNQASPSITCLNPDPGGVNDTGGILIEAYAWRQSSGGYSIVTDNLSVGEAFTDVCDVPTPNESETWGGIKGMYR